MTKHVSSDGEATSSSRETAMESLPIRESAGDAAQRLPQDATGARGSDGIRDVIDLKDKDTTDTRTEALVKDVTHDSAKGIRAARSAAGSSTIETRLGGVWASPDAQNAVTIGIVSSASAVIKKARTKARGPWYCRRAVVGAVGVALLAGPFGIGWGTNEFLSSHSQYGQIQQQGAGNGQGMLGGDQGGPDGGGPGGQGGPDDQMPGGGPGGQGGPSGQDGQGGPGGGLGGADRIAPNGDVSSGSGSGSDGDQQSGSGSGDANQKGGSGSSGVPQQQDASPGTQGRGRRRHHPQNNIFFKGDAYSCRL